MNNYIGMEAELFFKTKEFSLRFRLNKHVLFTFVLYILLPRCKAVCLLKADCVVSFWINMSSGGLVLVKSVLQMDGGHFLNKSMQFLMWITVITFIWKLRFWWNFSNVFKIGSFIFPNWYWCFSYGISVIINIVKCKQHW